MFSRRNKKKYIVGNPLIWSYELLTVIQVSGVSKKLVFIFFFSIRIVQMHSIVPHRRDIHVNILLISLLNKTLFDSPFKVAREDAETKV